MGEKQRMEAMNRDERRELRALIPEISTWVGQARAILARRQRVSQDGHTALDTLRGRLLAIRRDGALAWDVLPLGSGDQKLLGQISALTGLSGTDDDLNTLEFLDDSVAPALKAAKRLSGPRRWWTAAAGREAAQQSAIFLQEFHEWATASRFPEMLNAHRESTTPTPVMLSEAIGADLGLVGLLTPPSTEVELLSIEEVASLPASIAAIDDALRREGGYVDGVRRAADAVRNAEVIRVLAGMPVERLREASDGALRLGPLDNAGITSVLAVLQNEHALQSLPGIGVTTATRISGAAHSLWRIAREDAGIRLDPAARTPQATELLSRLNDWDSIRQTGRATSDLAVKNDLTPLAHLLGRRVQHLVVVARSTSVSEFRSAVASLEELARRTPDASTPAAGTTSRSPWDDFLARPADYYAMLSELGFSGQDERKAHGDLPEEIVEAVRRAELDTQHLNASLRGYQSFAARFALAQRKVLIGDEMGLGKTIESLAVLTHLYAKGSRHLLVVCPAAVVTNWVREIDTKSSVPPHRVHGPDRESAAASWRRDGGIAVTTFETLEWFAPHLRRVTELACVVVDEAHYIKNPDAQRSQRVSRLINRAERAVLLTGTPIENRIDEFHTLIRYLRPDLVVDTHATSPRRFRQQVAPAYLRRNQEDVLDELPQKIETDDWIPMSDADIAAYRAAVEDRNFAAMRQAAMLSGRSSAKMRRLIEIVREAEENNRRVIVFSQFRATLDAVAAAMPGTVFGPLTGSVPAHARQQMVDRFSAARHGAVLVSQIVAGGVGLNVQAASVVVICEPQLKPSAEWQAIARAHRMGQLDVVQVHRLLSEEGVDRRVRQILARKARLFDEFARVSETAGSAPEAVDISESEIARQIVEEERSRLLSPQ